MSVSLLIQVLGMFLTCCRSLRCDVHDSLPVPDPGLTMVAAVSRRAAKQVFTSREQKGECIC